MAPFNWSAVVWPGQHHCHQGHLLPSHLHRVVGVVEQPPRKQTLHYQSLNIYRPLVIGVWITMFEAVYMHYKAAHLRFVEDNDGLPSRGGQTTRQKNFPDLWKISSQYKIVFPRIINGLWTDVSTSLFERNSTLHIKTLGRSWTNACSKSPGSNYEIMLNMYNEHRFVFTWLAARALIPNFWQSWWCCCSITDSGHMTVTVDP